MICFQLVKGVVHPFGGVGSTLSCVLSFDKHGIPLGEWQKDSCRRRPMVRHLRRNKGATARRTTVGQADKSEVCR